MIQTKIKFDEPSLDKWRRYRFLTKSTEDYRPLLFNPQYPWWCSGEAADGSTATIIAWLPINEDLLKYWDDASEVEYTEHEEIEFTFRFPKPDYFEEEGNSLNKKKSKKRN